jgi:hypothetical protein
VLVNLGVDICSPCHDHCLSGWGLQRGIVDYGCRVAHFLPPVLDLLVVQIFGVAACMSALRFRFLTMRHSLMKLAVRGMVDDAVPVERPVTLRAACADIAAVDDGGHGWSDLPAARDLATNRRLWLGVREGLSLQRDAHAYRL